ncbi:MAG: hypothetical protein P4M09_16815 [Devosia sp.]|nr:hypothetical protein [Devosia sp.]
MVGDVDDIIGRLKAVLPRWFPDSSPIATGALTGFAVAASFVYGLIAYAKLQTRVLTATDGWADLIAWDFFAGALTRLASETDAALTARIVREVLRVRTTRAGVRQALIDLTGRIPWIFEPRNPQDTGGYGMPCMGYGLAGGYGSTALPFQAFIVAYRPASSGIPLVNGYGQPAGGYGVGRQTYADLSQIQGAVSDAQIYAAIDGVKPAASIMWTRIAS